MIFFYQMILCALMRTTLGCKITGNSFLKNNITAIYGDCMKIPIPDPLRNVSFKTIWFHEVSGKKEDLPTQEENQDVLKPLLPPGDHMFGLRLECENGKSVIPDIVRVSVTPLTKRPQVEIKGDLAEGNLATLTCTALYLCNEDKPTISWKNKQGMSYDPKLQRSVLPVTLKAEDHNTNITCQVRYKHIEMEQTFLLKVQYSPKIQSSSKCVLKDDKVHCRCVSHGNPRPSIKWFIPCGSYQAVNAAANGVEAMEEIVLESHYRNSTVQCVSSNIRGSDTISLKADLKSMATGNSALIFAVSWAITGVSLSLNLAMCIIVIYQYKQNKKCSEEINFYASLRKASVEHDYSVIVSPCHKNAI